MANEPLSDPRDYILDLSSRAAPNAKPNDTSPRPTNPPQDDTLAIHFRCCNAYAKIRLTADRTAYAGHCPKCARAIRVEIDPNSPNTGKFFTAE
jgi:hypothetical protein